MPDLSLSSIYCEEFAKRVMSFEFAEAALILYFEKMEKKWGCFSIPSLGTQDTSLKKHSCSATSFVDEDEAPPTAFAVAIDVEDDDD